MMCLAGLRRGIGGQPAPLAPLARYMPFISTLVATFQLAIRLVSSILFVFFGIFDQLLPISNGLAHEE